MNKIGAREVCQISGELKSRENENYENYEEEEEKGVLALKIAYFAKS